MNKKLLLIGGGGHCKSVLDTLLQTNQYSEIAIIDKQKNVGKTILGVSIIGCDGDLLRFYREGYEYAFVTVGSIGNPILRVHLFKMLYEIGFKIPNIIDSSAVVSCNIRIETGIFIGKSAVVNAGAIIYKGAIINTGAIIEHDCIINEFVHIAPRAVLSGEVQVGKYTHIGANCVIKQQLNIGADSIIGMGSVVVKNIGDNTVAYGNPCKKVR
jgi:sugar O-acyltransferase (sialic acid O-acetyltransferase NeuD family)